MGKEKGTYGDMFVYLNLQMQGVEASAWLLLVCFESFLDSLHIDNVDIAVQPILTVTHVTTEKV